MEFKRPTPPQSQQKQSTAGYSSGQRVVNTSQAPRPGVSPQSYPPRPQPVQPPPQAPRLKPQPYGLLSKPPKRPFWKKWWLWVLASVVLATVGAVVAGYSWYQSALQPKDPNNTQKVRIVIDEGSTPSDIASTLESEGIIKSARVFSLYARSNSGMQAGGYALSPSMSVAEIVDHLTNGVFDTFNVTFIPGSTIWDIEKNLIDSGFSEEEVSQGLSATYDHPLLASKPKEASLEGYIYPDTYQLDGDATVEDILTLAFDELYKQIQANDIEEGLKKREMSLYEGLTLASIIQKEVANPDERRQVAQVFYKRLADGMPLGADATFIYGAKVLGIEPRVTLDSPYNTRQVGGLPPGPISNVEVSALLATVNPAEGDYLYFVSGDDGVTHFTRTEEEHEAATAQYCHENCDIFRN